MDTRNFSFTDMDTGGSKVNTPTLWCVARHCFPVDGAAPTCGRGMAALGGLLEGHQMPFMMLYCTFRIRVQLVNLGGYKP